MKVKIGKVQQLFDLNNNIKNFHSTFTIQSTNSTPFFAVVADQSTLDSGSSLQFKYAQDGSLSGEVRQDEDENKSWYLVLKSDQPNEVDISIDTKQVPPRMSNVQKSVQNPNNNKKVSHIVITLVIVASIAMIIYLGYKYFDVIKHKFNNSSSSGSSSNPTITNEPDIVIQENDSSKFDPEHILGSQLLQDIQNLPEI